MPTWAITDDTSSIAIAQNGVVIKNIDKDIVVLRIVPAGVGLNTTAIDQLYIEHDGEYSTQIPYNDVTVSGVTPSSVENFRTRVLTILNNNGAGGGIDSPIVKTVDQAQAFDIGNDGVDGQTYRITSGATDLPTGIAYIDVKCVVTDTDVKTWDSNGFAYVTTFGKTYPCIYDVATNKINVILSYEALITQTGTADPVITEIKNDFVSCTFTPAYSAIGTYTITPSYGLISLFTAMWMDNGGTVGQDGMPSMGIRFFNVAYNVSDFIDIASWKFSTTDFALQDDILLNSKIVLYGQIKN